MRYSPIVGDKVELELLTTLKCNLSCSYCVMLPGDVLESHGKASYSMDELDAFCRTHLDGKTKYFTFFGGEPLLNRKFIAEVMERFPDSRFNLWTNGTLLKKVPKEMLERFSNMTVSIDGGKEITDSYRGAGVFDDVLDNVRAVRPSVKGTMVGRVTWASEELAAEDIIALLDDFDFVNFQFAQLEGVYSDVQMEKKKREIERLVDAFLSHDGLLKIVPLMGMAGNMLFPEGASRRCFGETQCRVSTNLLNVHPDGKIFACSDMAWIPEMQHGSIKENVLFRSPLRRTDSMPCNGCEAFGWCRSNCLKNLHIAYEMKDGKYREAVVEPVCSLVRHFGKAFAGKDLRGWFAGLSEEEQSLVKDAEIYDFLEVMP